MSHTLPATALASRLRRALPQADVLCLNALAADLHRAWAEPQRAYHTLQHLAECLAAFDDVEAQWQWPESVLLALLFHDAVYDPERHDNEARSAHWAARSLTALGASAALTLRVSALVMATQSHQADADDAQPEDTALLLDIDLAILGSTPARFAEYEAQIRREYAFVPQAQYVQARAKVMRGFAERRPIFKSLHFQQQIEAVAHRNLAAFG